jgi:hypothetical protein
MVVWSQILKELRGVVALPLLNPRSKRRHPLLSGQPMASLIVAQLVSLSTIFNLRFSNIGPPDESPSSVVPSSFGATFHYDVPAAHRDLSLSPVPSSNPYGISPNMANIYDYPHQPQPLHIQDSLLPLPVSYRGLPGLSHSPSPSTPYSTFSPSPSPGVRADGLDAVQWQQQHAVYGEPLTSPDAFRQGVDNGITQLMETNLNMYCDFPSTFGENTASKMQAASMGYYLRYDERDYPLPSQQPFDHTWGVNPAQLELGGMP